MKKIPLLLFIVYFIILLQLVLFKGKLFYHIVPGNKNYRIKTAHAAYKGFNVVPFRTIYSFLTAGRAASTESKVDNILGNIALFVPFGFLVPFVFKNRTGFKKVVLAAALVSLCFELYQFITHTGEADVDDIILNTLGGMMGYGAFVLFSRFYQPVASKE